MTAAERGVQIWPLLVAAASIRKQTTGYVPVGREIGVPHFGLAYPLETIQAYCLLHRIPLLNAMVVNRSGRPGVSCVASATVEEEKERVFEYDWQALPVPTAADLHD